MARDLTQLAREPFQTGESSSGYTVRIGRDGRNFTDLLDSATILYSVAEEGSSEMDLSVDWPIKSYQNAEVRCHLGYGSDPADYRLWFRGELQEPRDDHYGDSSTAKAWGQFKTLEDQTFNETMDYRGYRLDEMILHATTHYGGQPPGAIEIRQPSSMVLEGDSAIMGIDTGVAAGINAMVEAATWVGADRPGRPRLYMPRPQPGVTGQHVGWFDFTDFEPGAFVANETVRGRYAQVIVFRKGEQGSVGNEMGGVFARVAVDQRGPYRAPRNRAYQVADYPGSQGEADAMAADLSRMVARGVADCSIEGLALAPDLAPYDVLRVIAPEFRDEGGRTRERYKVTWSWVLDGLLRASITQEDRTMDLGGRGVIVSEKKLPKPFYMRPKNPYLVRS